MAYICIDIGGTSIKYGLIDEKGELIEKNQMATEAQRGGRIILQKVKMIVAEYMKTCRPDGICISTSGMVDCEKGELFYAGETIPDYSGTQFKKVLEEEYKIPCEVENDVNCAGLAEYVSGAAAGSRIAVCLTVGTGIGGCILLNGKVLHGASNSACEVGYMNMHEGNFQTLGSSSTMSRKVAKMKGGTPDEWDGIRIFDAAAAGDEICRQAIGELADILGKGIANICYVINPEIVVLGGGITEREEILRPLLMQAMKKYLKPVILEHTKIAFARQRNNAGMLGAYYNFRMRRDGILPGQS
ncbi:MAG: ROK family protein [Eubacteriales bacterium]|nr:ROK family protein [Eubacteriales bacterium]